MAKLPGPKSFWDIIKSINVLDIQQTALAPLHIALVGRPEEREALRLYLCDGGGEAGLPPPKEQLQWLEYDSMAEEDGFPQSAGVITFVLDTGGGRREGVNVRVYTLDELGGSEKTMLRVLDDSPQLLLPLARTLPALRKEAARRIIAETAGVNAQFALLTGVAEQVPILGQIGLPAAAFSDMIMLTKNQVMMTLKLAGIYGLNMDLKARSRDLIPIQGNAFGWRAVARELVGAIPIVGFLPRAAIAYAGTQAVGRAMQFYYETGEQVTPRHLQKLYREALAASRDTVKTLAAKLPKTHAKSAVPASGRPIRQLPPAEAREIVIEPDKAVDETEPGSEG